MLFISQYSYNYKMKSILGKRKYKEAFNHALYDDLRYGCHIDVNFFKNGGVGHGVRVSSIKQSNFECKEKIYK